MNFTITWKKIKPGRISARVEIIIPVYVTRDEIFSPVNRDEISHVIANKSASLSRPLACIFNASIQEGNIPSLWKSANVSHVPKSSPALDIDSDFRPISLTPIVSKVLESFPQSWLLRSVSGQIDNL
jgi:hypothetical protein